MPTYPSNEVILKHIWPDWQLEKTIGRGTYGQVCQIKRDEYGLVSRAAVKIIPVPQDPAEADQLAAEGMSEEEILSYYDGVLQGFVNEIQMLVSLKGAPHIVSIEDYKVTRLQNEFQWYILIRMELLTPFLLYTKEHPLTEKDAIRLGIELCEALEICHGQNIIHRDIKPQNVFVDRFGSFKLGDFGIARKMEGLTGGLSQKGTYGYIAPEVVRTMQYDLRADICSLGLVMYQQTNEGRLPFLFTQEEAKNPRARTTALQKRLS